MQRDASRTQGLAAERWRRIESQITDELRRLGLTPGPTGPDAAITQVDRDQHGGGDAEHDPGLCQNTDDAGDDEAAGDVGAVELGTSVQRGFLLCEIGGG